MPFMARSVVLRRFCILPVMALLACTATSAPIGSDTDSDSDSDTGSDSDSDSDTETDTDADADTGDGEMPEPDMPQELGPCALEDCPFGTACVEDECVEIEEPSACAAPLVVALPQPSANGRVVALDLVDLQQDGDVEIVAWIDEVGVGVLDDLQWTKSEYLPAVVVSEPSIAAIHADQDNLLDVLLNDGGNPVQLGLGDGTGSFAISTTFAGISLLRGITLAPDDRRAFGVLPQIQSADKAAYIRFDEDGQPTTVELTADAEAVISAQLDGTAPQDVVFNDRCEAYATRLDADGEMYSRQLLLDYQPLNSHQSVGHCHWASADFDGDGRDELIARELLHYGWDVPQAMLLTVLPNTTAIEPGLPDFSTPQRVRIPNPQAFAVGGDFDGDGDDELLLASGGLDGGGTLVWASDGELTGCMAELPSLPGATQVFRTGDIDGDGDDELVLFRENGELRVLDLQ
jgi:hypothetical protein